jgi:hypothetical protein
MSGAKSGIPEIDGLVPDIAPLIRATRLTLS